ncbi:MAG: hypothetical protein LBC97_11870 [Bifidobacteriaceae bacterium]|jgi:hypothetical protein|nr:hypothetical protein [Bifidobacteriaceae bacterium]
MTASPWPADQPAVTIAADQSGALTVELHGAPYTLPDPSLGRRDQMGRLLDHFCQLFRAPFQARVTEADGTIHQGWVPDERAATPAATPAAAATEPAPGAAAGPRDAAEPAAAARPGHWARHAAARPAASADDGSGGPVAVGGDGFIPNETVAFAVVVAEATAALDGTAVVELPADYVRELAGDVALIGRLSGTLAVRQPASQL